MYSTCISFATAIRLKNNLLCLRESLEMFKGILVTSAALLTLFATTGASERAFHPNSFPKSVAQCKGLNRKEGVEKNIDIRKA